KTISVRMPPNASATARAAQQLAKIVKDSADARDIVVEHNRQGKPDHLLIGSDDPSETLFPAARNESERVRLLTKLATVRPKKYEELLAEAHAGSPPGADNTRARLQSLRDQEVNRVLSGRVDQKLTPDEEKRIRERLS